MKINFEKLNGLVPAIIQDSETDVVLMLGFMNEEAWQKTQEEGRVCFFSRTKNRLWTKGETSGNYLNVKSVTIDCDNDTLLIKVKPEGPVCHTGTDTCFGNSEMNPWQYVKQLEGVIDSRKNEKTDGSYVASLFNKGINKIAQKIGEEAVELVIEAKDNNDDLFLNEASDLFFHLLILLKAKNYGIEDVIKVLEGRKR